MTDTPNSIVEEPLELWRHPNPEKTQMWRFKDKIEKKYNLELKDYFDLHQWSIDHIPEFWEETWYFTNIISETQRNSPFEQVNTGRFFTISPITTLFLSRSDIGWPSGLIRSIYCLLANMD